MRIGWRIPLPGPFYVAGTVWQSGRKRSPHARAAAQVIDALLWVALVAYLAWVWS